MHRIIACSLLLCLASLITPRPAAAAAEIDATPYLDPDRGDAGIQLALNAASEQGGGIVILPAGRFVLERYLYLPSNVTLKGQGESTILALGQPESTHPLTADVAKDVTEVPVDGDLSALEPGQIVEIWTRGPDSHPAQIYAFRCAEVRGQSVILDKPLPSAVKLANNGPHLAFGRTTALAAPAVKGEQTIRVEHPELLRPQQGIALAGKGDLWDHHFNAVSKAEGDVLTLERSLTVDAPAGTPVRLAHCAITADGEANIGVESLVIRGWDIPRPPRKGGFVLGGIHFVRCSNATVKNVGIHHWNGDAFSFQAVNKGTVDGCTATHNRGHGFHPGTECKDVTYANLLSENNGGDGVFYCWNNQRVTVRNSRLLDNDGHGVGGLGIPGERDNLVEGNVIERNGLAGVELTGGRETNNIIRGNTIRDNSAAKPGAWPGILLIGTWRESTLKNTIEGNTIQSTLAKPTQWIGIEERPFKAKDPSADGAVDGEFIPDHNRILNNKVTGHKTADIVVRGPATTVEANEGKLKDERPGQAH